MPNLRLIKDTTSLLRVGTTLAAHDDCCCSDPVDPIYYCYGCRDGVFEPSNASLPVTDYPDFVLDELTYTISGFQNVSEFLRPAGVANVASSNSWKNLDLFNGTFIVPVYHSTTPNFGNAPPSVVILGNTLERRQTGRSFVDGNYSCPTSQTMHPTANPCFQHGPTHPNWTVCPPNDLFPNTASFNNCCCENQWAAHFAYWPCGEVEFSSRSIPFAQLGVRWLSLTRAGISLRARFTQTGLLQDVFVPWSGNLCTGNWTASASMFLYDFDAFATDQCAWCVSTPPTPSVYTISVTATPTWVVPP